MTATASTIYWNATAASTVATCVVTRPRHTPGIKLTQDQRNAKSDQHKFGLCCDCDTGLDDRADFIVGKHAHIAFHRFLCNDCSAYYTEACTALRVRRFLAKNDDHVVVFDPPETDAAKGGDDDHVVVNDPPETDADKGSD